MLQKSRYARNFFFTYMRVKNCGKCGNVVNMAINGVRTPKNCYHKVTTVLNFVVSFVVTRVVRTMVNGYKWRQDAKKKYSS